MWWYVGFLVVAGIGLYVGLSLTLAGDAPPFIRGK